MRNVGASDCVKRGSRGMEKEPRSRNNFLLSMCCMCLHQNIFQKLLREGALGLPGEKNTTGKFAYLETILSWTIEGFLVPREKASIVQELVKPVPICQNESFPLPVAEGT